MKIALILGMFNPDIVTRLHEGVLRGLVQNQLGEKMTEVFSIPGCLEAAPLIQKLVDTKKYDGFIVLGAVIKGETHHFEAVCEGVTYGLQKVSIENRVPVMNGVLMCYKKKQALNRSDKNDHNKGTECVNGLITMLELYKKI